MTTLILVRHGESVANYKGLYAGHSDFDLHDNGIVQAKLTAEYIKDNYNVDKIYSSDLLRAYKTAQELGENLDIDVITNPDLREIYAGEWEGMVFDDIIVKYEKEYKVWLEDVGNAYCVGGESVKELGERIMNALDKIAQENEGKTVAIFTHATPIRAVQSIIEKGSVEKMADIPWVSNSSVTVVAFADNQWELIKVGIDDHLAGTKTKLPTNV